MQALGVASLCAGIVMCIPSARAIDCADIKPVPPQNSQTTLGGAADGRIDGLFKRLIGGEAKADFNYQKAVTDILPQFPDSDRLYVWERVLFLKCQVLNEDKTLDTRVKLGEFDQLLKLYDKPPPAVSSPAAAASTVNNSGNNSTVVGGNGNSVSVGPTR